jgi:hypothetical protein
MRSVPCSCQSRWSAAHLCGRSSRPRCGAAMTAREVGDDESALAARARMEPLLDEIQDPYMHAVSRLAMAWTSAITGDSDGALRWASVSLAKLRGQDEPLWTTLALVTVGSLETALGRHDDALRHSQRHPERGLVRPSWLLRKATPNGRRCSRGRPRACAGAPGSGPGRPCGAPGPSRSPWSARRWARTGSTRYSPPGPGSASGKRWPPSGTGTAPGRPEPQSARLRGR